MGGRGGGGGRRGRRSSGRVRLRGCLGIGIVVVVLTKEVKTKEVKNKEVKTKVKKGKREEIVIWKQERKERRR